VRLLSLALLLGSSAALACGSNEPSGDGDSDGGGGTSGAAATGGGAGVNGGTSPQAGSAGSSIGGSGASAGSGASGGGTAGTASAGTSGAGASGTGGAGIGGSAGTGGSGADDWTCDADQFGCYCGTQGGNPLTECDGSWPCCLYYVDDTVGELCYCTDYTEAECLAQAARLAASSNGRRETNCPP
jgi:hypothetical protein